MDHFKQYWWYLIEHLPACIRPYHAASDGVVVELSKVFALWERSGVSVAFYNGEWKL